MQIKLLVFLLLFFNACAEHDDRQSQAARNGPEPSPSAQGSPAGAPAAASQLKKSGLTYEDRKAWREVLKWPDDCEQGFDYPDKSFGGIEFHRLADGQYLVAVTCTLGAYQVYQSYYFYD